MPDIDRLLRQAEDHLAATPPNIAEAQRLAEHVGDEMAAGGRPREGEVPRFQAVLKGIMTIRNQDNTQEPVNGTINDHTLET